MQKVEDGTPKDASLATQFKSPQNDKVFGVLLISFQK